LNKEMTMRLDLSIPALRARYLDGSLTPAQLVELLDAQMLAEEAALDRHVWIRRLTLDEMRAHAAALDGRDPKTLPLYGIPFAIKDNIDLAGIPTTAACPAFAYTPQASATVVQRLIEAGAIPVGKTNLDQFATGLVGVRSPYGACRNSLNPDYVSGGSSAGSAVSVALGRARSGELFAGHRHGRIGPRAGHVQQPGRLQADLRPDSRHWRGAGLPHARRGVGVRADRRRCRHGAGGGAG
jgi:allophanate hydrolase